MAKSKGKNKTNNYVISSQTRGYCRLSCKEVTLIIGELTLGTDGTISVTREYQGPFPLYNVKQDGKQVALDKSLVTFIGCKNDTNIVELSILD